MREAIAIAAILSIATYAPAGCPSCPAPGIQAYPAATVGHPNFVHWFHHNSDPGRLYLYEGNQQLGGYDIAGDYYREVIDIAGNLWGDPSDPPVPLPLGFQHKTHVGSAELVTNFGVDRRNMTQHTNTYRITDRQGSRTVSRDTASDAVRNGVPDDRNKLRLTIIGSDQERAVVEQAVRADARLTAAVNVWSVTPEDWSLRDNTTGQPGFVTTGHPTVYLTKPDGEVLWRTDSWTDADFQAIRKRSGSYDPAKDPGSKLFSRLPGLAPIAVILTGLLSLLGLAFYRVTKG